MIDAPPHTRMHLGRRSIEGDEAALPEPPAHRREPLYDDPPNGLLIRARGTSGGPVMTPPTQPGVADGPLVLADISGYTSFLRSVAEAHQAEAFAHVAIPDAYALVSSLLDGIVQRLTPPFTLSKLEGDAVFAFATDTDGIPRRSALLDCLSDCHAHFRRSVYIAHAGATCSCGACARLGESLDLKFVLHAGPFVIQSIAGGRELIGPEVVMAHRLLKSRAGTLVRHRAYAVITDAAAARFEVPTDTALPLVETFEHYAPIRLHVFPLGDA
jgi:hypothetical protein